jgi:hypothetical protein
VEQDRAEERRRRQLAVLLEIGGEADHISLPIQRDLAHHEAAHQLVAACSVAIHGETGVCRRLERPALRRFVCPRDEQATRRRCEVQVPEVCATVEGDPDLSRRAARDEGAIGRGTDHLRAYSQAISITDYDSW